MFEIDEQSLPFVLTRQALLLLDLQNDFISADGLLPMENPPDFLERTLKLIPEFRACGNIIWIRSIFEASRPVNQTYGDSESVITDRELPTQFQAHSRSKKRSKASQKPTEQHEKTAKVNDEGLGSVSNFLAVDEDEEDSMDETFLTVEPGRKSQKVLAMSPGTNFAPTAMMGIDGERDLVFQKTWYSAFKDGSLVQTLRAKFVTEIYICGALTNISVFATAMDAARHGYAITIVEDCLGYRSKARHDEALRRLTEFTGCDIVSSAELIDHLRQKSKRHEPTPRRNLRPQVRKEQNTGLEDTMANLTLRPDVIRATGPDANSTGPPVTVAVPETAGSSESQLPELPNESPESNPPPQPSEVDGRKRERVKTKIKTRRRHSKSVPKDISSSGEPGASLLLGRNHISPTSTTLQATSQALGNFPKSSLTDLDSVGTSPPSIIPLAPRSANAIGDGGNAEVVETESPNPLMSRNVTEKMLPSNDNHDMEKDAMVAAKPSRLCEGDTTVIEGLLDDELANGIFEKVRDEVRWQKMSHQGGDVPRLVSVQGEVGEDGSIPIYRHPADESPPLLPFSATVSRIREQVEKKLGHPVNHALIQFYRDGTDYISEHSDKTLDIVPKTFIANVSLGAQRTMVFRTKKPLKSDTSPDPESSQPRQACRAPLPHNSMCKMGLVTNMRWLHGIRQDKRLASEKSVEELAYNGGRISLTFRLIGTFIDKDQKTIWGQGAIAKTRRDARAVINGDLVEFEKMIRAFGQENHSSEFDWKATYGEGFDVLHLSNSPKLFLSGDFVADTRVKIMLAEYGIAWTEGKLSPSFNWKDGSSNTEAPPVPETLPVKFVDNDLSKSTVIGDLAIMLYLETVYGSKSNIVGKSQVDIARQFTRFQKCGELLKKWRATPFSVKPFRRELELWENFSAEASYIAGPTVSLADYALWPVLQNIRSEWKNKDGFDNLFVYYCRMRERDSIIEVFGPVDFATSPTLLELDVKPPTDD